MITSMCCILGFFQILYKDVVQEFINESLKHKRQQSINRKKNYNYNVMHMLEVYHK